MSPRVSSRLSVIASTICTTLIAIAAADSTDNSSVSKQARLQSADQIKLLIDTMYRGWRRGLCHDICKVAYLHQAAAYWLKVLEHGNRQQELKAAMNNVVHACGT